MRSFHLHLAHALWQAHLRTNDLAVDATLGNGYDTEVLLNLGAEVVAMDVQVDALERAAKRIGLGRATLLLHSHAPLPALPRPPRLIVYNLGYLPGGDKERTTMTEVTLASVAESWERLSDDGALSITCYPGHSEGAREELALLRWVSSIPHTHYCWQAKAPSLLWIPRRRGPAA